MPDPRVNFAASLVATAPSPATTGTSLTVTSGDGAKFPTTFPFNAVVCPANASPTPTNSEIVRVIAVSTDTFTITRITPTEPNNTTARSITVGDQIFVGITAKTIADLTQGVPAWAGDPNRLLNQFDPRRHTYNWKASNTRHIRRGLAYAAKGGISTHVAVGDSATAGCNSVIGTTLFDRLNAWPLALRNSLAGMGVPMAGTGLMRAVDSGSYLDSRYTVSGVWNNNYSYANTTSGAATATCIPDLGGTILETHYQQFSGGGTFTVSVNGTVVDTIVSAGTTAWIKRRVLLTTPIIAGQTTVKLAITTIGSGVNFRGWNVFTPNGGLMMHNLAQSGSWASTGGSPTKASWTDAAADSVGNNMKDAPGFARQITDASFTAASPNIGSASGANFTAEDVGKPIDYLSIPGTGIVIPENTYIVSVTSATAAVMNNNAYVTASSQTVNIGRDPDCIHIEIGFNDLSNGTSASTIISAITTIRGWYPNSDCILHIPQEGAYTVNSQANQDALATAMYSLADTLDCIIFDWRDRLGRYATAQALGVYGDVVHMIPSAQGMMGALLAEVVGESSGKTQSFGLPTQDLDFANKQYVDYVGMEANNVFAPATNGYETFPRVWTVISNQTNPMTSGRLMLAPIVLPKGYSVGHINFVSGTTAAATLTHWWFGLYDPNFVQLAVTADQTSTAWAANTAKSLAVATTILGTATSYITQYTGRYYVGVMIAATTLPSLLGVAAPNATVAALTPAIIAGLSDSSQTTPPTFPHTATTVSGATIIPYAYVTN